MQCNINVFFCIGTGYSFITAITFKIEKIWQNLQNGVFIKIKYHCLPLYIQTM